MSMLFIAGELWGRVWKRLQVQLISKLASVALVYKARTQQHLGSPRQLYMGQ